jgi:hypothetical protein
MGTRIIIIMPNPVVSEDTIPSGIKGKETLKKNADKNTEDSSKRNQDAFVSSPSCNQSPISHTELFHLLAATSPQYPTQNYFIS